MPTQHTQSPRSRKGIGARRAAPTRPTAAIVRPTTAAHPSNPFRHSNTSTRPSTIRRSTNDPAVRITIACFKCCHPHSIMYYILILRDAEIIYDEGYYGTITSIGGVDVNSTTNPSGGVDGQCPATVGTIGPVPFVRVVKRRTTANKKERRRTQSINSAFTFLRDCIPNVPSDTKLSKVYLVIYNQRVFIQYIIDKIMFLFR